MKFLILFLILQCNAIISVNSECAVYNLTDGSAINWNDWTSFAQLGTFAQDEYQANDRLPGGIRLQDLVFQTFSKSSDWCKEEYFGLNTDGDEVTFNITESFQNFDQDVVGYDNVKYDLGQCQFFIGVDNSACSSQRDRIYLEYYITDTNTHYPKFNSDSNNYEINVSFPLAEGLSLLRLSELDIYVTDIDFSTKNIQFSIDGDSDAFEIVPDKIDQRNFYADLKAKKLVYQQIAVSITIRAIDDGTNPGPLSSNATITIIPEENTSTPPTPEFEPTVYQGEINASALEVDDIIMELNLKENYLHMNVKIESNGEESDYFGWNLQGKQIEIILKEKPNDDFWFENPFIILTVVAEINDFGKITTGVALLAMRVKNLPVTTTTTTTETTTTETTQTTENSTHTTETSTETSTETTENSTTTTTTEISTRETTITSTTVTDTDIPGDNETIPTLCPPSTLNENNDLKVAVIVLCIIVVVLLAALIFGYFKYVRGRKKSPNDHLLDSDSNNSDNYVSTINNHSLETGKEEIYSKRLNNVSENNRVEVEEEKNIQREPRGLDSLLNEEQEKGEQQQQSNLLKPDDVKTRKRSMTFSESDDESRQHRESLDGFVKSDISEENKQQPIRKKSVYFQTE